MLHWDDAITHREHTGRFALVYLGYVHSFRAIAILIIVGGHAIATFDWAAEPRTEAALLDLLDNGTVLFVFVAGFLFAHLSDRFRYLPYLGKRFVNVILPYLFLSVPAVLYDVVHRDAAAKYPTELGGTSRIYQAVWFLVKGSVVINYALWFIPMITLYYLASPLFVQVVRRPRLYAVIPVLLGLSLLIHRNSELDTFGMAVYYLSAYLTGMWACHARARLETFLLRWWPWLLGAFGVLVLLQITLFDHHGNYYGSRPFSQEHGPIDWMFAQKMLLCFGVLGLTLRYEDVIGGRLSFLGDISFTVFFVHVYILWSFGAAASRLWGKPEGNLFSWLIVSGATVALAAVGAALAKRTLRTHSRYFIGY
jgi:hypothetical protein